MAQLAGQGAWVGTLKTVACSTNNPPNIGGLIADMSNYTVKSYLTPNRNPSTIYFLFQAFRQNISDGVSNTPTTDVDMGVVQ